MAKNQEGVDGTDSEEVWIRTDPPVILVICASLRESVCFFLLKKAHVYLCSLRVSRSLRIPWALEDVIRYLETQKDWMGNYEQWREEGYPVGSGLVERAVAVVINMRMKKRGIRWKRANATAVVALRVQRINSDWEAVAA